MNGVGPDELMHHHVILSAAGDGTGSMREEKNGREIFFSFLTIILKQEVKKIGLTNFTLPGLCTRKTKGAFAMCDIIICITLNIWPLLTMGYEDKIRREWVCIKTTWFRHEVRICPKPYANLLLLLLFISFFFAPEA